MLKSNGSGNAVRNLQRLAAGMATAAARIGDTKVAMSLLEKGAYINYQRIEDNLEIVRQRCVHKWEIRNTLLICYQTPAPSHPFGEDSIRPS